MAGPRVAVAQQGWSGSPEDLANTFPGSTPWVAMDRAGNAMTVWNETGSLIFARRYSAADRTWDQPVPISGGLLGNILDIVMDLEGNATVLYQGTVGLYLTRYSASSRTWSEPHLAVYLLIGHNCRFEFGRMVADVIGQVRFVWTHTCSTSGRVSSTIYAGGNAIASVTGGIASASDISPDTAGNAIALWAEVRHDAETLVRSADYSAGARMWGPPTTIFTGPVGAQVLGPRLDTDGSGNILAAWQFEGGDARVRAARFDRTNSTWGEVTDLSDGPAVSVPEVAVDVSGNGVAMWAEQHGDAMRLHAARYNAASAAWSRPIDVTPIGRQSGDPSVAFDGYGNLTATWWESDGAQTVIRAARLSTTDVTTSFDLARFDQPRAKPALSVSDNGAAAVLWVHDTDQTAVLQAAHWDPTPAAPSITGITPGEGILTVAFAPPLTVEPAFAPTYYEYLHQQRRVMDDRRAADKRIAPRDPKPVMGRAVCRALARRESRRARRRFGGGDRYADVRTVCTDPAGRHGPGRAGDHRAVGATHLRPAADKLRTAGREPAWRGPGFIPDGQPDADVHVQRPPRRVLRPGSRACRRGMEPGLE